MKKLIFELKNIHFSLKMGGFCQKFSKFSFVLSFFDGNMEMRARLVMFVKLLDRDFRVIWRWPDRWCLPCSQSKQVNDLSDKYPFLNGKLPFLIGQKWSDVSDTILRVVKTLVSVGSDSIRLRKDSGPPLKFN